MDQYEALFVYVPHSSVEMGTEILLKCMHWFQFFMIAILQQFGDMLWFSFFHIAQINQPIVNVYNVS